MSDAFAKLPHTSETPTPPSHQGFGKRGFFAHHGLMSLGVRLFRKLQFQTKAMVISGLFVLPIAILSAHSWRITQEAIDSTKDELAGTAVLRTFIPAFESLLAARQATRAGLGGLDTSTDYRTEWANTDKAIATLQKNVADSGDVLHLSEAVARTTAAWKATSQSTNGTDGQGGTIFGPVTQAMVELLTQLGDKSGLVLDPDTDTLYLANAMILAMPVAAEDLAKVWGFGTVALARGGIDAKGTTDLHVWSAEAASRLVDALTFFNRASNAKPVLSSQLDLAPMATALAFSKRAMVEIDAGQGDPRKYYAAGMEATKGMFKTYDSSITALDDLLHARNAAANYSRNVMFGAALFSMLAAAYFFYAFFLVTRGGLQEVKRHLEAMTRGDLTTSPNPWGKDEAAALMLTMRDMQSSLRTIVARVRGSSGSIVTAGSEIAAASVNLSERTEQTAANLEKTASSMEQISATVQQTANNVREAAQVASDNSESAARGGVVIAQVVSTMQDINAASKRISDIIGTIDSIAFQTNILALNAAVEAARAGEQGRGFAVVATEVRSLAQRSAQAAREIKTLITTSVGMVESGAKIVNGAGTTMQELVSNAKRMNDLLADISTAATEQSSGVGQVGLAVSELDQMTQQNAALVEQSAASASSLKDQAVALATEVAAFKLPASVGDR